MSHAAQLIADALTLEDGELFHTKKGKARPCPPPLAPRADTHGHLTVLRSHDPALAVARAAIAGARAWAGGDLAMMASRAVGGHAMGAARPLRGAARFAAYAAGQAACVPHVPEHDLGAAAYAIKAVRAAAAPGGARSSEPDGRNGPGRAGDGDGSLATAGC